MLHPGEFVLGSTLERIGVPDDLVGRIEGKSSLGRLGLLIHSTAGFIDAGFDGHITLELTNIATLPITLYPGHEDRPGQLHADDHAGRQARTAAGATGSKYQGQRGPTPSRYFENFETYPSRRLRLLGRDFGIPGVFSRPRDGPWARNRHAQAYFRAQGP